MQLMRVVKGILIRCLGNSFSQEPSTQQLFYITSYQHQLIQIQETMIS